MHSRDAALADINALLPGAALTDWLLDVYYRRVLPAKLAGVASPASRAPPRVELVEIGRAHV